MVRAPAVTERVLTKRDLLGGLLLPRASRSRDTGVIFISVSPLG
ncbi:hypothetical protein ACFQH8_16960 [Halomicroarcula sp. GCM10025710]